MVASLGNGADRQTVGSPYWQIFETVDGDVDIASPQSVLQRLGEESLAADQWQRRFLILVPARAIDLDFDVAVAVAVPDQLGDVIRLPKRQPGAARSESDSFKHITTGVQDKFLVKIIQRTAVNR